MSRAVGTTETERPIVRFEAVAGEFSQHDFGQSTCASSMERESGALLRVAAQVLADVK